MRGYEKDKKKRGEESPPREYVLREKSLLPRPCKYKPLRRYTLDDDYYVVPLSSSSLLFNSSFLTLAISSCPL